MNIEKDLIFYNQEVKNQEELFKFMAEKLINKNYVTKEYFSKILDRESKYPTGFQLEKINVAIPHTDPICSKANKIIVLKLKNPINFINAETGEKLKVNLILGLIFKNGDNQIDILKKIGEFLQEEKFQNDVLNCKSLEELYTVMNDIFN